MQTSECPPYLQLFHLSRPAAALLTVDTTDQETQDLLLQLRVRVDLQGEEAHTGVREEGVRSQGAAPVPVNPQQRSHSQGVPRRLLVR